MFPFEHSSAAVVGLALLAAAAGAWFLHSRVRASAVVCAVLAAAAAGVDLADRFVKTDREFLEELFPRLAAAAERGEAAPILAAIDPALHPLRGEVEQLLARLRPEEILLTRLDVAVERNALPPTATADMIVRYRGDLGTPGAPAPGQALVAITADLVKRDGRWLVTDARFDDAAPIGGRRTGR